MCHLSPIIPRFVTVLRPPSDRIPSAARSDCVRRPIGLRSASDQIAFGVRSDCVRRPIGLRSVSYRIAFGVRCWVKTKQLFLNGAHPHFMGNNKGLYATMKRWRIDPYSSKATTIFTKTFLLFSLRFQNKSLAL